jgi:acetyl esterase/lipase
MIRLLLVSVVAVAIAAGIWAQAQASVSSDSPATGPAWEPPFGHLTMAIWPRMPPGGSTSLPLEMNLNTAGARQAGGRPYVRLTNVSTPTITLFKPTGKNTGAAMLVFPGGSYQILSMDLEGSEVCDWLNSVGVTCVLVKYRVPNSGPYPKSAAALQDAQRAMGLVRQHAAEWDIDPHRVGTIGFSAGAYLSAAVSNIYDKRVYDPIDAADQLSSKPDFSAVIYPGYLALAEQNFVLNPAIRPTADTPPTFILQAEDDPVHVENSLVYYLALKNAKVPAELHLYAQGGHGYGLRPRDLPIMGWPKLVETWLHTIKVLPAE